MPEVASSAAAETWAAEVYQFSLPRVPLWLTSMVGGVPSTQTVDGAAWVRLPARSKARTSRVYGPSGRDALSVMDVHAPPA